MKSLVRVLSVTCIASLLLAAPNGARAADGPPSAQASPPGAPIAASEASFEVTNRYNAQRRPRVTVLAFEDTNAGAQGTKFGSSVEAMLVTFLKRKSQFVVVERQELSRLLAEKRLLQTGMVQRNPDDRESQALLEKIDVFVLGSVTLLEPAQIPVDSDEEERRRDDSSDSGEADGGVDLETSDPGTETSSGDEEDRSPRARAKRLAAIPGQRIEIDVKLISRFDGRIIAAAQRSGPLACLRSIVERLGVALEQEFLRPYYGSLTVTLNEPEHIRVFLTPVLPEDALDEEKPPVELGTTVMIQGDYDIVEPWTTDPTTYTIRNVLSGWYSMRIERPGYSSIGVENARWEVRKRLGKEVVYDRAADVPLDKIDPSIRRFLVRVDPLDTRVIDGNALKFIFRKEGGSIAPRAKRQYLDKDFTQAPQRVVLMGGEKINLNRLELPDEYADDPRCDYFDERKPRLNNYGRTHIAAGQSFNFDLFTGGELIIEDYKGEVVPVGVYRMALWEPSYTTEKTWVTVHNGDDKKSVKTSLTRETAGLAIGATGPRPGSRAVLEGRETHHRIELPLNFEQPKEMGGVPADTYVAATDIAGLDGWQRDAIVPASNVTPPYYNPESEKNKPDLVEPPLPEEPSVARVGIKTRFGLAGRLEALSQSPDPLAADLFVDGDFLPILNLLLYGVTDRPREEVGDFWNAAAEAGRALAPVVANTLVDSGRLSPPLGDALVRAAFLDPASGRAAVDTAPGLSERTGLPRSGDGPLPARERLPRDPDRLRELLAERLEVLDLIVLDPLDMEKLRRSPEVAAILARYIASGGSLFAYVSAVGDYRPVLGTPLNIGDMSKPTRRLGLAPGELDGLIPKLTRKDVKVKSRRSLPEVGELLASWRTLAYTRGARRPRIIERPGSEREGYVALWLDDPQSFRGRWGGTRPKVEEIRARLEEHVLQQARAQMSRRFDRSEAQQQPCTVPNVSPASP